MRWEKLFGEIEAHSGDLARVERDAEIQDRTEGEWAATSWRERLALGTVSLRVAGLGRLDGDLTRMTGAWLLLQTDNHEMIINPDWVVAVSPSATGVKPLSLVEQRMTWVHAIRMLQRERSRIHVVCADGSAVDGTVTLAGKDFVEIQTDQRVAEMVPYATLAAIRCRGVP